MMKKNAKPRPKTLLRILLKNLLPLSAGLLGFGLLAGAATAAEGRFSLSSPDIAEGQALDLAQVYTGCGGQNISPALLWNNAPEGTKSFVVTAYDPDAPTGSGWWHWVMYDIPAEMTMLAQGAGTAGHPAAANLPASIKQARTDYGFTGFGGACPPAGAVHRYQFMVYAMSVPKLEVPAGASPALIGFVTRMNSLASAHITALYTR